MIENAKYFHDATKLIADNIIENQFAIYVKRIDELVEDRKNAGIFRADIKIDSATYSQNKTIAKKLKSYYKNKGFKFKIKDLGDPYSGIYVIIDWKKPKILEIITNYD